MLLCSRSIYVGSYYYYICIAAAACCCSNCREVNPAVAAAAAAAAPAAPASAGLTSRRCRGSGANVVSGDIYKPATYVDLLREPGANRTLANRAGVANPHMYTCHANPARTALAHQSRRREPGAKGTSYANRTSSPYLNACLTIN